MLLALAGAPLSGGAVAQDAKPVVAPPTTVVHRTVKVDGLDIFYREAGPKDAPAILLLHGFPTCSQMFRNLIPALADEYHVVAPDYPGFGHSSMPPWTSSTTPSTTWPRSIEEFTEEVGLKKYALYVQDYGAAVGYRLAIPPPGAGDGHGGAERQRLRRGTGQRLLEAAQGVLEGAEEPGERGTHCESFSTVRRRSGSTRTGSATPRSISPDAWTIDQRLLDRPGNAEIQSTLFYSYGSNPPLYPQWQAYFRKYQPPTLIVWGKNDQIFPAAGAEPYKRDLKTWSSTCSTLGHFALEEDGGVIANHMRLFLRTNVLQKGR